MQVTFCDHGHVKPIYILFDKPVAAHNSHIRSRRRVAVATLFCVRQWPHFVIWRRERVIEKYTRTRWKFNWDNWKWLSESRTTRGRRGWQWKRRDGWMNQGRERLLQGPRERHGGSETKASTKQKFDEWTKFSFPCHEPNSIFYCHRIIPTHWVTTQSTTSRLCSMMVATQHHTRANERRPLQFNWQTRELIWKM